MDSLANPLVTHLSAPTDSADANATNTYGSLVYFSQIIPLDAFAVPVDLQPKAFTARGISLGCPNLLSSLAVS